MFLDIKTKTRADLRIHKSYEFLEQFYLDYPRKRLIFVSIITLLTIGLVSCLIFR